MEYCIDLRRLSVATRGKREATALLAPNLSDGPNGGIPPPRVTIAPINFAILPVRFYYSLFLHFIPAVGRGIV